jgi:hypothetical protein
MENQTTSDDTTRPRGWPLFLVGLLLILLGPILYVVQFQMAHLTTPWYAPILGTLGVILMLLSLWRGKSVLLKIGFFLGLLFCAFEWFMILQGTTVPHYTGPAQPGEALPSFTATLADGATFSNKDLQNGKPAILLFFRGHW